MKKILIPAGILAFLVFIWFLFFRNSGFDETHFRIDDSSKVTRVTMKTSALGEIKGNLTLEKLPDGEWVVDGKYPARLPRIEQMLRALTLLEVQNTIRDKVQPEMLSLLKKHHTKVEVFEGDQLIRTYLIGALNNEQTGNLMMMEQAQNAYIVTRAGMEGFVSIIFNPGLMEWREKQLWNISRENLKSITISYTDSTKSFTLNRQNAEQPWQLNGSPLMDQNLASTYANQFEGKIFAESFAAKTFPGMLDSLKRREPDFVINWEKTDGSTGGLMGYMRPENANNFFGWVQGEEELYTIQHFVFDKFLMPKEYFLPGK